MRRTCILDALRAEIISEAFCCKRPHEPQSSPLTEFPHMRISTVKETELIRASAQSHALLQYKVSPLHGVIQPKTPSTNLVENFTQLSVEASALR